MIMLGVNLLKRDKLKAVIVGSGRIGASFDTPDSESILSHAHAFSSNQDIILSAIFDIDCDASQSMAERWGCRSYQDFELMMDTEKPDIVSVCVPDEYHYEYLKKLAGYSPRIILSEKPITKRISESEELLQLFSVRGIPVNINYIRRFDPYIIKIRNNFTLGKFGKAISVNAVYGKGLMHNGTHLVDFFRFFFGGVQSFKTGYFINDYIDDDPSIAFEMKCEVCDNITVSVVDSTIYTAFEIHMFFEKCKISLLKGGLEAEFTAVEEDPVFNGYKDLINPKKLKTGLNRSLEHYIENSINSITKKEVLRCSIGDAFETQKICDYILNEWSRNYENSCN